MKHQSEILPDEKQAYYLPAAQGERYVFGTQLATIIAPARSTGSVFELVILSGGKGDSFPLHRHDRAHEGLYVLSGKLELILDGQTYLLTAGDYASIPAGVAHSYRLSSHRTRLLSFTTHGEVARLYATIGEPFTGFEHPEQAYNADFGSRFAQAETVSDFSLVPAQVETSQDASVLMSGAEVPGAGIPYVLEAGEGIRLIAADQLFTLLTTQANTDGQFVVAMTEGPKGDAIIQHYHEHHTEMFFCLDGEMTVWTNGQELRFQAGDFLHVPANTVHSYRLNSPYTRFIGFLTPGLFEPFFHTIGDPYQPHVYPTMPGPFHFDRLMQGVQTGTLDLKVVGPPPDGSGEPPASVGRQH